MAVEPIKPKGRRKPFPGEEYIVTRSGSPNWHFDFTIEGTRFRGNCGTGDVERAAALAASRFGEEFDRLRLGIQPAKHLTLNAAFSQYYQEVGKGTAYGDKAQRHQMARMLRILPRDMTLAALSDSHVNDLVQVLRATPKAMSAATAQRHARLLQVAAWRREDGWTNKRVGQELGVDEETARRLWKDAEKVGAAERLPSHGTDAVGPATINRYINTLSAVCKRARETWGVEVGEWSRGKHLQAEPEGREVFLEMDVARAVLANAIAHVRPLLAWDIVTGLRKANATHVMWEQINLTDRRATFIGKGNKKLAVPLPDEAMTLLQAIEPDPAKRKGPVFYYGNPTAGCSCSACVRPDMRGQQFKDPKRSIKTAFRLAGLPPTVRMHDLRHTFASWLLASGGDLKMVQQRLHHANIATTMRYVHIAEAREVEVVGAAVKGLLAPSAEVIALPAPLTRDEEAA